MIVIDASQIKKLNAVLGHIKNGVPRALAPAINRALASGQTTIKREIRKDYLIKAKDIPTAVHRATFGSLKGEIRIRQGMLDASKFFFTPRGISRRKNRKPVYVKVKKGGGGTILRGFTAHMIGGGIGPMQRRAAAPRLPIRKVITIGAPIMASQPAVGPAANKAMGDTFAKRLDHEINRVMASAGGHS